MTDFDPVKYLTKLKGIDGMPIEHRQKISAALKQYNESGGHLRRYQGSGPEHPNFKGGIKPEYYRRIAFEAYGKKCNRCGTDEKLLVHHIDENRRNSAITNLEVLCHSCHMRLHHGIRVDWTCPVCAKTLHIVPSEARRRVYCSASCRNTGRAKGVAA
jgi:HNH endonuclease.